MNSPVLIVRTVSIEKLSPLLDVCRMQWPEHPLIVATNPGRESELRADSRVADVISCATGVDGFSAPIAFDGTLIAVVVPVANAKGSGYANVMQACDNLRVSERYLAPYSRDLRKLSALRWAHKWRWEQLITIPARWIGHTWATRILRNAER